MRPILKFLKSRRGNIAIITALVAPVLVGFCGLGAETGYDYFRQRDLQGAADIAAYDGAMTLEAGSSATLQVVTSASTTAASGNGWHSAQGTITVNNPPQSGPNQSNSGSVEVLLTENETRFFTALFNSGTLPISVRAVAKYT